MLPEDFEAFDLRGLPPKESDSRIRRFPMAGHEDCAELDALEALPATELRERVRAEITAPSQPMHGRGYNELRLLNAKL